MLSNSKAKGEETEQHTRSLGNDTPTESGSFGLLEPLSDANHSP
jgi:hypothetical protein